MNNETMDYVYLARAQERTVGALNAADSLITFVIDLFALRSKSKVFKGFAFIWTILNVADKVRMIFANLNARNQALEYIEDEDIKEAAEEGSTFKGIFDAVYNLGIKYQITGRG